MAQILVLAGGTSDERDVSLRSGYATIDALKSIGHEATFIDANDSIAHIIDEAKQYDVVFLALHGKGGEDGTIQKELESHNIPFVGSGSAASMLCFDKWRYYEFTMQHGLPSPTTELVNLEQFHASPIASQPYVLKPNDGGSSIDTLIARDPSSIDTALIADLFGRHPQMILQSLISGQELTVAVVGDQALPVIEIIPPEYGEFDYENKYNGQSQEICPPEHISESIQAKARQLALSAHQQTGCRDMSRTDFMLDTDGELYILETNTIPGLTPQSLLPKAAAAAGMTMPALIDTLVQLALQRN